MSYVIGVLILVLFLVAWVGVQLAWRRVFPEANRDPDVLASRGSCGACGSRDRASEPDRIA